jgi:predicted nuclease of predicted toxin-antitoxin system
MYWATVEFLHGLSYDVVTVQELGLEGTKDVTIIHRAVALERALLTRDMDFGSILLYHKVKT